MYNEHTSTAIQTWKSNQQQIKDQRYSDAISVLNSIPESSATRAGLSLLGHCFYQCQDFAEAANCYEQLCALLPDNVEYKYVTLLSISSSIVNNNLRFEQTLLCTVSFPNRSLWRSISCHNWNRSAPCCRNPIVQSTSARTRATATECHPLFGRGFCGRPGDPLTAQSDARDDSQRWGLPAVSGQRAWWCSETFHRSAADGRF